MKKLILVLMLFITSFIAQAQDTTLVTNTVTEKLIDKYSAKVEASIISLATALKQPAEHIYAVLVKQQVVYGYSVLLGLVLSLIFCLAALYGATHINDRENEFLQGCCVALTIIFGIITIVTLFVFYFDGLPAIMNPEYGAMKDIASFFK